MANITPELIKNLDLSNVYGSVLSFSDQVKDSWEQSENIVTPPNFSDVENIIVSGMGGSALGARVVAALYGDTIKIPLEIINDYRLPGYVGPKTLVIADSYSGSTEETLSSYEDAKKRGAKIFVIATGGKLEELARNDKVTSFIFKPLFNPSNQPRMGLGYAIGSIAEVLSRLEIIDLRKGDVEKACAFIKNFSQTLTYNQENSEAMKTAEIIHGKIPVLIGAGHLLGSIHTNKNQINENAKTFSVLFAVPELNHHLMEGLKFPESNPDNLAFIFYESGLYLNRIQKRFKLTKELTEKNGIKTYAYKAQGENKLEQALEVVQFGAFVGFYLSLLNGINPAPIPTVDWFKEQMG